jgi:hypothetical protein
MFGRTSHPLDPEHASELAQLMKARQNTSTGTPYLPAGYTYLGQFIDHDITFDPTSHLGPATSTQVLENFRTPGLDLDSLYGSGPVVHPFLYDWEHPQSAGARLLVGHNPAGGNEDLPRNDPGRALVGDTRNDENVIVAQLHLLFIKFHNAVLDGLDPGRPWYQRFEHTRNIVRWHYQWLVVHEFLPRILGTDLAKTLIGNGLRGGVPRFRRRWLRKRFEPYVPLEFSIGAYRFGHSLVRSHYILRRDRGPIAPPQRLFPDLQGQRPLRPELVIDWRRFFRYEQLGPPHQPQNALQIDSALSGPLFDLPDGGGSLPERTLIRAAARGVPSGQEVAARLGLKPLDAAALRLQDLPQGARQRLLAATPLWYYVLCEAEREGGDHLGPLGGRIVADVILGLLGSDKSSYVHQQNWRPSLGVWEPNEFWMTDLIEIAT